MDVSEKGCEENFGDVLVVQRCASTAIFMMEHYDSLHQIKR